MATSEKIVIPAFIVADIYKNHLIEFDTENVADDNSKKLKTNSPGAKPNSIQFLGQNKKNIIVLVSEPNETFISDLELSLLSKILNACNLNIGDIAIINTHKDSPTFDRLEAQLKPAHILLLGVTPSSIKLPFSIPDFQVQHFSNCSIVCLPPLSSMLAETDAGTSMKRKLWVSLQKTFNLS